VDLQATPARGSNLLRTVCPVLMSGSFRDSLSACHGYAVHASDGLAGEVETPLFPDEGASPDYLVLRVTCRGRLLPRFPVLPVVLVEHVDDFRRRLVVAADRSTIEALPSNVPVVTARLPRMS
jgi:hypothetical protein